MLANTKTQISRKTPKLISILRAATEDREELSLATFEESQVLWAVETGLGPLLFHTAQADPGAGVPAHWSQLQSTNLTVQVLTHEQLGAMSEIIDGCAEQGHVLTLLKGISICEQYYPEPHFRPMRDLDFLVSEAAIPFVESFLANNGYRRESKNPPEFYEQHHHTTPFFHPQKGIWVEVHRRLFPLHSKIGSDKVFHLGNIEAQLRPSLFQGKKVTRLSDELQIIYIAAHWTRDLSFVGGMIAMLDIIYLLKNVKEPIRWGQILDWMQGSVVCASLYLLLTYLARYDLIDIPHEIIRELSLCQKSFGNFNLAVLHFLIDRYLVEGKTFGRVLSKRTFRILWRTLLSPGPPLQNIILVPWNLLPSRLRITTRTDRIQPSGRARG